MRHARIDTPDGFRIVHADGTEPEARDAAGPMLHLLPKLYVGPAVIAACPSPRVSCAMTVLSPSGLALPERLVVRQPLPNRCYLVAGTDDSRYGFLVPLPPELPEEVIVRFAWRFTDAGQAAAVRSQGGEDAAGVDHVLWLCLWHSGRGQVFSMDTASWPDGSVGQPFAMLGAARMPNAWEEGMTLGWDPAADVPVMGKRLLVPGVLLSDVWGLTEHAEEQLHEVEQTVAFDPASSDTLAHRANACVEMPAEVLVEAVRLARGIPFGEHTPYAGSMAACERHPALLALCGWWNRNAPDPRHRRAGLCGIDVRVHDDGEYWPAYCETPTRPVDHPVKAPGIAARVGDVVLVEFHQGQHAATFLGGCGCELRDVAGNPWQTVGVPEADVRSGECDEGWYTLNGLAALPERFPAAWVWLTAGGPGSQGAPAPATAAAEPDDDGVPDWGEFKRAVEAVLCTVDPPVGTVAGEPALPSRHQAGAARDRTFGPSKDAVHAGQAATPDPGTTSTWGGVLLRLWRRVGWG